MFWSNFLHLYQPPTQYPHILKQIVDQSYLPLLKILDKHPKIKTIININASLTEQLAEGGHYEIVQGLKRLAEEGRIEFTGSACYHALLPKISESEVIRQIRLNEEKNKKYFGEVYNPTGFFPPEMAYSPEVGKIVRLLGYKWIILEEGINKFNEEHGYNVIFHDAVSDLDLFFRNKDVSVRIAFSQTDTVSEMVSEAKSVDGGYLITAMDGETFGHHHVGQLDFLENVFSCQENTKDECSLIKSTTISELLTLIPNRKAVEVMEGCWAVSDEEIFEGNYYPRWDYPGNQTQILQWQLLNFAVRTVNENREEDQNTAACLEKKGPSDSSANFNTAALNTPAVQWALARDLLDRGLNSDQFFWASGRPYWHYYMIEKGAGLLRDAIMALPDAVEEKVEAERMYNLILETARKQGGERIVNY